MAQRNLSSFDWRAKADVLSVLTLDIPDNTPSQKSVAKHSIPPKFSPAYVLSKVCRIAAEPTDLSEMRGIATRFAANSEANNGSIGEIAEMSL